MSRLMRSDPADYAFLRADARHWRCPSGTCATLGKVTPEMMADENEGPVIRATIARLHTELAQRCAASGSCHPAWWIQSCSTTTAEGENRYLTTRWWLQATASPPHGPERRTQPLTSRIPSSPTSSSRPTWCEQWWRRRSAPCPLWPSETSGFAEAATKGSEGIRLDGHRPSRTQRERESTEPEKRLPGSRGARSNTLTWDLARLLGHGPFDPASMRCC